MRAQLCLFVTSWTVACQAPLTMGFSMENQPMEWVAIYSSRESSLNLYLLWLLHWQVDSLSLSHLGSQKIIINFLIYSLSFQNEVWYFVPSNFL